MSLGQTNHCRTAFGWAATGYFRDNKNPVHTILFPDSRIYAYANFDKGKAYGLETKLEVTLDGRRGLSGYVNYAVGRVYFWNPVVARFVYETHHLEESGRFLAPMDQTRTVTRRIPVSTSSRPMDADEFRVYGSGTPLEAEDESEAAPLTPLRSRVPGHFTQDLTVGMDLLRHAERAKLGLQVNVENLTNNIYEVSQESIFSPGEYFHSRFFSASMEVHF